MKLAMPPIRIRRPSRRQTISILGVVGGVVLIAYIAWSVQTWNNFEASWMARQEQTKSDVAASLALPATTTEDRQRKQDIMQKLAIEHDLNSNAMCTVTVLIAWQSLLVSTYKDGVVACNDQRTRADAYMSSLTTVLDFLRHEQTLAQTFANLKGEAVAIPEDQWPAKCKSWQDTTSVIDKLTGVGAFDSVRNKARESAGGVAAAWQEPYRRECGKRSSTLRESSPGAWNCVR